MTQNNSTDDTEVKSPKKSRRSKAKYPALKKRFNLKMRQDYIEPDYINGVYDANGNQVIRPLNDEEKTFLNSFYEEVIGANFMHNPKLKELHTKMKELKNKKTLNTDEKIELKGYQDEYYRIADEVLLYSDPDDQKKLYGENNARNRCIFNRIKSVDMLDELNDETYDEIHRNMYNNPEIADRLLINKTEPVVKTILKKKKK